MGGCKTQEKSGQLYRRVLQGECLMPSGPIKNDHKKSDMLLVASECPGTFEVRTVLQHDDLNPEWKQTLLRISFMERSRPTQSQLCSCWWRHTKQSTSLISSNHQFFHFFTPATYIHILRTSTHRYLEVLQRRSTYSGLSLFRRSFVCVLLAPL